MGEKNKKISNLSLALLWRQNKITETDFVEYEYTAKVVKTISLYYILVIFHNNLLDDRRHGFACDNKLLLWPSIVHANIPFLIRFL